MEDACLRIVCMQRVCARVAAASTDETFTFDELLKAVEAPGEVPPGAAALIELLQLMSGVLPMLREKAKRE